MPNTQKLPSYATFQAKSRVGFYAFTGYIYGLGTSPSIALLFAVRAEEELATLCNIG